MVFSRFLCATVCIHETEVDVCVCINFISLLVNIKNREQHLWHRVMVGDAAAGVLVTMAITLHRSHCQRGQGS